MKVFVLTLIAMLFMSMMTPAQNARSLTLCYGKQKVEKGSGLTIKFIEVVEDSRCPEGVNCIWAGNAKIKVKISDSRGSKITEMNTTSGQQGDQYGGYAVNLVKLTPVPRENVKTETKSYTAEFSIARLYR